MEALATVALLRMTTAPRFPNAEPWTSTIKFTILVIRTWYCSVKWPQLFGSSSLL